MENVFTTNAGGSATRKARIAFQLPVGQYRFKMFYSKNSTTLSDARRLTAWYRIDASGVIGTPVNQWDAGFNTQHTHEWARELVINVTDNTPGNVMFNMWSTSNDQDSGINFFEITKL